MKKYLIILLSFVFGCTSAQKRECTSIKNECIPDSNYFSQSHVKQTFLLYSGDSVKLMKQLNANQMDNWLKLFPEYAEEDIRMASFQGKHLKYYSLLLLANIDYMEQCLINIDTMGNFIDGLKVAYTKNIGNMGFVKNKEGNSIVSVEVRSRFNKDTISIFTLNSVSRDSLPENDSLIWKELYVKKYLINKEGKINLINNDTLVSNSKNKK